MISREYENIAGAGGVKDVCRQLSEVLAGNDAYTVSVVLPRYGFVDAEAMGFTPVVIDNGGPGVIADRPFTHCFSVDMHYTDEERRETVAFWQKRIQKVNVFLVEADRFAEKLGVYTYTAEEEARTGWQKEGAGHFDYFAMNILLQKAALDFMLLTRTVPWVVHCQDGHAALLPAMIREKEGYRHFFNTTGAVVTIHNAGTGYHQEIRDWAFAEAITGLPPRVIQANTLDWCFDPFVAASGYAVLNTVSENYGRELQETQEDSRTGWLGHVLKERGVIIKGVTNGIDADAYNPADSGLPAVFDILAGELDGKQLCKDDMLRRVSQLGSWNDIVQFGTLTCDSSMPLVTFIGRLTGQKGISLVLDTLVPLFTAADTVQLLVLGAGESDLEERLQYLTAHEVLQGRLCFLKGFDPAAANQVYAAGDFFLIPSWFEPCGLTDYIAQLFGNLPIVHHVGGLVKVVDQVTGFSYATNSVQDLQQAVIKALRVYRQPEQMLAMQQAAVKKIVTLHTWERAMEEYVLLYEKARAMALS
ncbi:MAG: glycogen synthase [Desulfobulbus propionicus]|nr:MAG: glycogen synthase [Desulfobulbus propionicus]